jgi:protein-S-isoprenylcysteine O-methyltransferase Ste14
MSTEALSQSDSAKPLRLWPGIALAILLLLVKFVFPTYLPDLAIGGVLGVIGCGILIAVWWLLFSRAPWLERIATIAVSIGAGQTAFTRMPWPMSSMAPVRVRPTTACLLAV